MIGLCNGCIRCRDERLRGRVCVLDRSLSSDLCHDRCACMAGHKNTLIKKQKRFFGLEGRLHGVLPRVSPSVVWCVICVVLSLLCFIFRSPAHPSMLDRGQQRRPNLSRPRYYLPNSISIDMHPSNSSTEICHLHSQLTIII
ncbi:hypothetical protein PRUPE_7G154100 [Prunus persica]|uniref:Uncharacterized protein n=1 Tax=Prunus persica TaxID=3760 RepID=A0A251NBW7_PRUPE|nr:hypothetical protein PRUPE_7G154100 [Prunus persica]